jgi:hypothetical protein
MAPRDFKPSDSRHIWSRLPTLDASELAQLERMPEAICHFLHSEFYTNFSILSKNGPDTDE